MVERKEAKAVGIQKEIQKEVNRPKVFLSEHPGSHCR